MHAWVVPVPVAHRATAAARPAAAFAAASCSVVARKRPTISVKRYGLVIVPT
jgi:hypothetical protein